MATENLYEKLIKYAESDFYPFHMPGHKRMPELTAYDPYKIDITEIDGFDNLHNPAEILKKEQERAASLYGSKHCYYLVNGSTCGILAAIASCAGRNSKVLVARNCHKSVYNAIELLNLTPVYAYPENTQYGICGHIKPEAVKAGLMDNPDIKAVIITSPTYDGVVSDVKSIAEIVHEYDIPLIVDEAHGAHFGFHDVLPENAVRLYADAVIMSLHKTLPSYTQTALLHICSDRINKEKVERNLDIFETSSPSYILMSGISRCIDMLCLPDIKEKFEVYITQLKGFYESTKNLIHFKIPAGDSFNKDEAYDFDIGKINIITDGTVTGKELYDILLNKYHIQTEMAGLTNVLAMTSIMDTEEGFKRLADAIYEIDRTLGTDNKRNTEALYEAYPKTSMHMIPGEAASMQGREVPLSEVHGCISAAYIRFYPPGVPVVIPGEEIGADVLTYINRRIQAGFMPDGIFDNKVKII